MSRLCPLLLSLASAAALACEGGQVGEETVACTVIESLPLELDQTSPLGVSAGELLDELGGRFAGEIAWADGERSPAMLELSYAGGPIEYQDREWRGDGPQPELAGACDDVLAIEVRAELESEDGRLAESWTEALVSATGATGSLSPQVEGFSGTLAVGDFVPEGEWDEVRPLVDVALSPSSATVTISGQASRVDGDVASAQTFPVGELTAARP